MSWMVANTTIPYWGLMVLLLLLLNGKICVWRVKCVFRWRGKKSYASIVSQGEGHNVSLPNFLKTLVFSIRSFKGYAHALWCNNICRVLLYPTQVLVANVTTPSWGLKVLLLLILTRKIRVLCVKLIFRCQAHANNMSVLPPVHNEGLGKCHMKGM